MPELPEVEAVRIQISESIVRQTVISVTKSSMNLRKPLGCNLKTLSDLKVSKVSRWGKRLLIHFDNKAALDVSLGMTGMLRVGEKNFTKEKHDHVVLGLKSGKNLIYNDPRRFGWVTYLNKEEDFAFLGWDPIVSNKNEYKTVVALGLKSKKSIYSFLMDQKYIVGLGNIYVQEILFRSKISPFRLSCDCSIEDFERIRKSTLVILKKALSHGGSTILSYKNAEGETGSFQNQLKVYGKKKGEPCKACGEPLCHVMEARSISFCSFCQI